MIGERLRELHGAGVSSRLTVRIKSKVESI